MKTKELTSTPNEINLALGIDVGGSGIKGGIVDIKQGKIISERIRVLTPGTGKPDEIIECIKKIVDDLNWKGMIGCGFPAAIKNNEVCTAANIHQSWIGVKVDELIMRATGNTAKAINDADAAGLAEIKYGAGAGVKGAALMITIGTGLGTALFFNGQLMPNTELGHIEIAGKEAEKYASDAIRKNKGLSMKKWAKRFNEYLTKMDMLFWPDIIILGGGISKKYNEFSPYITVKTKVTQAALGNNAGIIGAAFFASGQ